MYSGVISQKVNIETRNTPSKSKKDWDNVTQTVAYQKIWSETE